MKIQLLLLSTICAFTLNAQQRIQTTQFWNNYSVFNPALNSDDHHQQASLTYKNVMTNDFIVNNNVVASYGLALNKNHAIGVNYYNSFINRSVFSYLENTADINYSYKLRFSDSVNHWLSFGAGVGVFNYNSKILYNNGSQNIETKNNITFPLLNIGIAYKYKNLLFGTGARNLTHFGVKSSLSFNTRPLIYVMGSYDFRISKNFHLKPQLLIDNSLNGNLLATFYHKYSVGVGFSNRTIYNGLNPISIIAQIDVLNKFRIGYSFDYATKTFNGSSTSYSHEIVLGFKLK